MQVSHARWLLVPALAGALAAVGLLPQRTDSACCYFSAKEKDILQPAQKAFITWDPVEKVASWTVQPKFEGNALDFGMVIPTPSRPKLDEMPRDFFKSLAVYSILKKREQPQSKLMYRNIRGRLLFQAPRPLLHPQKTRVPPVPAPAPVPGQGQSQPEWGSVRA